MTETEKSKHTLTKEQVREFLPGAVQKACASYQEFMQKEVASQDAKDFSAHHNACKVAIAHVNLLLKLAEWAEMDTDDMGFTPEQVAAATAEYESNLPKE